MNANRFAANLLIVVIAALVVAFVWQAIPLIEAQFFSPFAEPRLVAARGELAEDEKATIAIFQARRESVVYISTAERVVSPWTRSVREIRRGTGSGFMWDALGDVVTNNHVVAGASRALVRLADGRTFDAHLIGTDPSHDIAVLRIGVGTDKPQPIPIGRSENLQVGQKVFAIGNPFGLDWTLTTGIVSALDRDLPEESGQVIHGLIQTDAAINPGNSGGPLLDSAGRLIGMNTAIYSPSGSSAGIGFAVPVDAINRVVPQIIAHGHYAPPTIGVSTDPRADALAHRQGIDGVLVLGVDPGSPADKAGLRPAHITPEGRLAPGDIIIGLDGTAISTHEDLQAVLDLHEAGDKVALTILRDGKKLNLDVTLQPGL